MFKYRLLRSWPLILAFLLLLVLGRTAIAQITAHYINVGQAASALVEYPSGAILIDAGG
jgi:beta-lactamase superfamily II metal-dependent hydrolase